VTAFDEWVGRTRSDHDLITPFPISAMTAVMERGASGPETGHLTAGAPVPPGWHWLFFKRAAHRADLGEDGHERRGGFLPPLPQPRRMWAGGRLRFGEPLRLGDTATRRSKILSVEEKTGRSGALVFVTVEHEVSTVRGVAVLEEQDLVYRGERDAGSPIPAGPPPPEDGHGIATFQTDPVTLFRFSALTFNGHRIHYDHPYATGIEGYPGLVVHGPLLALLLLDAASDRAAAAEQQGAMTNFSYRAVAPVFCGEEIVLLGKADGEETGLWAATSERGVAMTATAAWGP